MGAQAICDHDGKGGWLGKGAYFYAGFAGVVSRALIAGSRSEGLVVGANRSLTAPVLSTRNFVKFHLIASDPSTPGA